MKADLIAGGFGTRISEEMAVHPKLIAEIGDRPILSRIKNMYHAHGISDFIICGDHEGYIVRVSNSN